MVANDNYEVREFTTEEKMAASSLRECAKCWNLDPFNTTMFTVANPSHNAPLIREALKKLGIVYNYQFDPRTGHLIMVEDEADQQTLQSIDGLVFNESRLPRAGSDRSVGQGR